MKALAKSVALKVGGFDLWHRARNRDYLTVLMFHRVLPAGESERLSADPEYTVTPELLSEVVEFCKRYYTPVGLEDVLASREGIRPLPPHPVLITFDDGWRDNLDYAQPVLSAAGVPWVVFAATDAVASPGMWWQEVMEWALRSGRVSPDELWAAASGDAGSCSSKAGALSLLLHFGSLPEEKRNALLEPYARTMRELYRSNIALSAEDLRFLRENSVSVGAHGSSHLPLSLMDRAEKDVVAARTWLSDNVDVTAGASISFPHGRYDSHTAQITRDAGYRLLFTSKPILNHCPQGWLKTDILGRILIATDNVTGADGAVMNEKLAPWLFLQERSALSI